MGAPHGMPSRWTNSVLSIHVSHQSPHPSKIYLFAIIILSLHSSRLFPILLLVRISKDQNCESLKATAISKLAQTQTKRTHHNLIQIVCTDIISQLLSPYTHQAFLQLRPSFLLQRSRMASESLFYILCLPMWICLSSLPYRVCTRI